MVGPDRFSPVHNLAVFAMVAAYCAYFSVMSVLHHAIYATQAFDLGTFDQGIWLAGHSDSLFVTVRGLHLLGDHVRVVSLLLAPIYWIWDSVEFLLILHACAIGVGGWFVFAIGRHLLPTHPWAAVGLAAAYLANPAVHNLTTDFAHPDGFATTLILASIYFVLHKRLIALALTVAVAMTCKEDVALVYIMYGLYLAATGQARMGIAMGAAALGYFLVSLFIILPYFNAEGFFRLHLSGFGSVGSERNTLVWIGQRLAEPQVAEYLWTLGGPLCFLFLLSPWALLPALPSLTANLISDMHYTRTIYYHYTSSIMPFLFLAGTLTLAKLSIGEPLIDIDTARWRLRELRLTVQPALVVWLFLIPSTMAFGYVHGRAGIYQVDKMAVYFDRAKTSPQINAIQDAMALIPPDAAVTAHFTFVPHLSHREFIYLWPNPYKPSNWAIRDENRHPTELIDYILLRGKIDLEQETWRFMDALVRQGHFERIAGDDSVHLYGSRVPIAERAAARASADRR